MDQVKCVDCGNWEDFPEEWRDLSDRDIGYLEDDYTCQGCWEVREDVTYYNNGMSELRGWLCE